MSKHTTSKNLFILTDCQKEVDRHVSHLLGHSLTTQSSQGWARPSQARSQELVQVAGTQGALIGCLLACAPAGSRVRIQIRAPLYEMHVSKRHPKGATSADDLQLQGPVA